MNNSAIWAVITMLGGAFSPVQDNIRTVIPRHIGDPEMDLAEAIAAGDLSLRGIFGYTVDVPGIRGDAATLSKKFEIRVIEGTSDSVDLNPFAYGNRARRYASSYNKLLFKRLGCDPELPMEKCSDYP
ncbi:hypothetical protein [Bradyrhizobium iriomotense]|uniref:hypothetical protein n=1 Tax=Bradyrhizobium iriomotense TaxID=441950 RepID=UPI001B8A40D2|nr:hypothetical protein [Bradyrhizobium iriomotense]MBR1132841.1 hypothetical protein [Bradyrhizobium iriomotense]